MLQVNFQIPQLRGFENGYNIRNPEKSKNQVFIKYYRMRQKYFAKKIKNKHGVFDSKAEYERFLYLKAMQDRGIIQGLQRQVSFEIIPKLTKLSKVQLKTKIKLIERVDEQAAHYTPDFCYYRDGKYVIEEVKSRGTALARDYPLRRKLIKQLIARHNQVSGCEWIFNEVKSV